MKRVQDTASLARRATKRRSYEAAFKRHLVELSLASGASVAKIALDHRVNASILFKWRRHHLRELARSTPKPAAGLLPGDSKAARAILSAVERCSYGGAVAGNKAQGVFISSRSEGITGRRDRHGCLSRDHR